MEGILKLSAGLGLIGLSLAFLYKPGLVLRWNALARALVFNDGHVLHYRRRWGLLFFVAGVLSIYSGFLNVAVRRSAPVADLTEGYRAYEDKRFAEARRIARAVLAHSPEDPHALFLLMRAQQSLGQSKRNHSGPSSAPSGHLPPRGEGNEDFPSPLGRG